MRDLYSNHAPERSRNSTKKNNKTNKIITKT